MCILYIMNQVLLKTYYFENKKEGPQVTSHSPENDGL